MILTKILSIISGVMLLYATYVVFKELATLFGNYDDNDFEKITENHTRHHISLLLRGWFALLSIILLLFHSGIDAFIGHFLEYNMWAPVILFSSFFTALVRHLKQERMYGDNKSLDIMKEIKEFFTLPKWADTLK